MKITASLLLLTSACCGVSGVAVAQTHSPSLSDYLKPTLPADQPRQVPTTSMGPRDVYVGRVGSMTAVAAGTAAYLAKNPAAGLAAPIAVEVATESAGRQYDRNGGKNVSNYYNLPKSQGRQTTTPAMYRPSRSRHK